MTVQEYCVFRLGVHRGSLAAANVVQLALTTRDLGSFPTAVEYRDYWAISDRTAWRHRARAHTALGDEWVAVIEQLASRIGQERSQRAVLASPLLATAAA
jgi:hypothetical protein